MLDTCYLRKGGETKKEQRPFIWGVRTVVWGADPSHQESALLVRLKAKEFYEEKEVGDNYMSEEKRNSHLWVLIS